MFRVSCSYGDEVCRRWCGLLIDTWEYPNVHEGGGVSDLQYEHNGVTAGGENNGEGALEGLRNVCGASLRVDEQVRVRVLYSGFR
jgi:hypothetical protein